MSAMVGKGTLPSGLLNARITPRIEEGGERAKGAQSKERWNRWVIAANDKQHC